MHEEKTILLVEDEALIAVMEKQVLQKHGFNVIIAHSGDRAINTVHDNPNIDLILMDINLGKGKMDGTETAELILKEKDIPILFLSSYTQSEVVEKTEKITSYGYVVKDSGETVLIASIKMAFKLYEAHQKVKKGAEQFHAITNTAIDGFWIVDIKGHILDVNEAYCSMTGYSRDELLKMSIPDLDAIEDEPMARQHMEKLIENSSDRFESKHRCKDGQFIDVEVSTILTQEQRCLVFIQDITKRKRAEEALLDSEALFRTLAESAPVGVYITDQDGNCIYINRRWSETAGMTLEEANGKGWMNGLHPEDRATIGEKWYQSVQSGGVWGFEYRFQDRAGRVTWVYGTAAALYATDGTITRYVGSNVDITDRKHAEEKERASERKYRIVADNTYDWEYWLDPQERFIYCSPSCKHVTGYKAEEFLADPDLYDRIVHPDHRTDFVAHKKGARHACHTDEIEFRIIRSDGTERWIGHACQAVYDDNGLFAGMRGSNRDITDRKQREEVIRESNLQLGMVIKASNTGLWDWDLKTNKVYFSPEWKRQIGYEEREISNDFSEWQNRVHPDDLERAQSTVKNFLENPYPDFENEYRFQHKNGSYRWILAKASVLTDEKGNPLRMLGSHLDITGRKKTEEELRYTNARLKALWDIAKLVYADFKTICDHILSEIVLMTKSEYGFFGFISEDESTMTIYSWSGDAMKDCLMVDKPQHFPISEAGVWAEAIRKRTPFVMNDYTIYHEAKKGCPDGHVIITNLLAIPIFSGDRIVSVVAVANKASVYDDDDISQITAFVGAVHAIIDRKRTEEALQIALVKYKTLFDYLPLCITVSDKEGKIVESNQMAEKLLGLSQERHVQRGIDDPEWRIVRLDGTPMPPDEYASVRALRENRKVENVEMGVVKPDEKIIWISVTAAQLPLEDYGVVIAYNDIANRKLAEDKIKSLLAEKELLLKETHHRVKNNMNTIIALLALQSDVLKEPSAIAAMHDAQSRIQSMMVLYDKLYLSNDFRKISTQEYLTSLIDQIVRNFPNRGLITIKKQIDDFALDAKILSNLGIILNELLTNAMKHAFIGKEHGVIVISLSFKGNHATLTLHDNGVGIPESVDIANSTGFGMQLIGILTEQLEGTIRFERQNGTKFIFDFDT